MMRMQTMESCPSAVVSSGRASMRVTRRLLLLISTLGGIRSSHRHVTVAGDTLLDEQFCQVYYTLDDNLRTCDTVRSQVRAERRGNGTPTLEMGNKDTQPAMVFIHGWPDTSALWVNQFAEFCGDENEYFCVAPSWIDYHPDLPPSRPTTPPRWSEQRQEFENVLFHDLKLTEITYVIFDFGVLVGSQLLYTQPDLISQVIIMDIPLLHTPDSIGIKIRDPMPTLEMLLPYQQNNIKAYRNQDDALMDYNLKVTNGGAAPCHQCQIAPQATHGGVGYRTGWPYTEFVRTEPSPWYVDFFTAGSSSETTEKATMTPPIIPLDEWELSFIPKFPKDVPVLYLWGSKIFQVPEWFQWIDNHRAHDGVSAHHQIDNTGHWIMYHQPAMVNTLMRDWLGSLTTTTKKATEEL